MSEWIGDTFTSDTGWNLLEDLVDVDNRLAGTEGERAGLELTRDALADVGVRDARIEEFDIQGWERGTSRVDAGDTTLECIALPRTPSESATAEFVDLGYGLPEDFERDIEGKIVMVSSTVPDSFDRFIHRREKYYYAVENDAAGFVFANHVEGRLPPTGSIGSETAPIGDIPAVGVSKEIGARLGRRFDGDTVTVDVEADIYDGTSGTVVAELGPQTDEEIVLSSHVDAHDIAEGAMDNGAGTATVVEVARALAAREDELDTRIRCLCYGAEEVGLIGSDYEAAQSDLDAIKAIVNVDSNVYGRTLSLDHHGFDELESAAERLEDRFDHPISTSSEMVPHSDHWPFVQRGVPGYMVSGETGDRGRGWGHTAADTLDKLEPRNLREQAILLTSLVIDLASDGVTVGHRDPEAIATALEEENKAKGMKVTGDWPF